MVGADQQISELFDMFGSDSLPDRLTAVQVLGGIDDLATLPKLGERLSRVSH